jgi:LmbE family N-acetylglucosaminyl deacetylase
MRHWLQALLLILLAFPLIPGAQTRPRSLMVLLAHADDETAAAPAFARYAREGVSVQLLIVTDGSGGSGTQTTLERPADGPVGDALVKARGEEARCAAAALGMQEPTLLAFPDGKLGDYLGDRALMTRLTDQVAKQIERLHPDVVVTWGPDGGTGHPDHRIVSNVATQLQRFGAPGMPARLFYMYLPVEFFRRVNPQRGEPPLLLPQPKYFTMQVPFTPADLEASKKAAGCHKTQFTPETLQRLLPEVERIWNGKVPFVPADPVMRGTDLFR